MLDAATLAVVKTIPVPDKPEFAQDDHAGHIYVNIESDPGQMVEIDSRSSARHGHVAPARLQLPKWAGHRPPAPPAVFGLRRQCDGRHQRAHRRPGRAGPIGGGPDAAAYDEQRGLVFSSNGEGTLTIIKQDSADHYTVLDNLKTQPGARTMALDPASGRVYLVTARFGPPRWPPPPSPIPAPRRCRTPSPCWWWAPTDRAMRRC